jgi:ATP-dependent helicase HrpB
MSKKFPIYSIYDSFRSHWGQGPLVISAATGSGKSSHIPRWCANVANELKLTKQVRVLVIEPRRVACRSLAQYVAQLEGTILGQKVGYQVRNESCISDQCQINFVTPGIALHLWKKDHFSSYQAVIIDEFHERSLTLDLLLALCLYDRQTQLIVMSATFAAQRLCKYMTAQHLQGEGRQYSIRYQYRPGTQQDPYSQDLAIRICTVVEEAFSNHSGDLLIFLPGKREIYQCQHLIEQRLASSDPNVEVLALHASLTLKEQNQVLTLTTTARRIILATNVAETSLTVPRITVVIDSGLVRQSRHDKGRSILGLTVLAQDSADQRAGRAGRLQAGTCYRLWGQGCSLQAYTKPEIYRESLLPLVLSALACGVNPNQLTWLDPPHSKAMQHAQNLLTHLGAIDEQRALNSIGNLLFDIGIDALWGRWLIQAQRDDCLLDMIDLVSALLCKHHLLLPRDPQTFYIDPLRKQHCDAIALIKAMRINPYDAHEHGLDTFALAEAHMHRQRLSQCFNFALPTRTHIPCTLETPIQRKRLISTLLKVDTHSIYIARKRKKRWAWCGIDSDIEWGKQSLAHQAVQEGSLDPPDGFILLNHHSTISRGKQANSIATAVITIHLSDLQRADLGSKRIEGSRLVAGELLAEVHSIFAKKTLSITTQHVQGLLAQKTACHAITSGKLWPQLLVDLPLALHRYDVYQQQNLSMADYCAEEYQLENWILSCLAQLGFEDTQDLPLLEPEDLIPDIKEEWLIDTLDRDFPYMIKISDAHYRCYYNLYKKRCMIQQVSGQRKEPPQNHVLPKCKGFEIRLKKGEHSSCIRARRH